MDFFLLLCAFHLIDSLPTPIYGAILDLDAPLPLPILSTLSLPEMKEPATLASTSLLLSQQSTRRVKVDEDGGSILAP